MFTQAKSTASNKLSLAAAIMMALSLPALRTRGDDHNNYERINRLEALEKLHWNRSYDVLSNLASAELKVEGSHATPTTNSGYYRALLRSVEVLAPGKLQDSALSHIEKLADKMGPDAYLSLLDHVVSTNPSLRRILGDYLISIPPTFFPNAEKALIFTEKASVNFSKEANIWLQNWVMKYPEQAAVALTWGLEEKVRQGRREVATLSYLSCMVLAVVGGALTDSRKAIGKLSNTVFYGSIVFAVANVTGLDGLLHASTPVSLGELRTRIFIPLLALLAATGALFVRSQLIPTKKADEKSDSTPPPAVQ